MRKRDKLIVQQCDGTIQGRQSTMPHSAITSEGGEGCGELGLGGVSHKYAEVDLVTVVSSFHMSALG